MIWGYLFRITYSLFTLQRTRSLQMNVLLRYRNEVPAPAPVDCSGGNQDLDRGAGLSPKMAANIAPWENPII